MARRPVNFGPDQLEALLPPDLKFYLEAAMEMGRYVSSNKKSQVPKFISRLKSELVLHDSEKLVEVVLHFGIENPMKITLKDEDANFIRTAIRNELSRRAVNWDRLEGYRDDKGRFIFTSILRRRLDGKLTERPNTYDYIAHCIETILEAVERPPGVSQYALFVAIARFLKLVPETSTNQQARGFVANVLRKAKAIDKVLK